MEHGKIETWDITSPFFRQALRDGNESAEQALSEAIEDDLETLSSKLCCSAPFDEAIEPIMHIFMEAITSEDEIAEDQEAMKEELADDKEMETT